VFSYKAIVKIDSVPPYFCLHHYVRNGLSYSAEETRPTLCKPTPSSKLGIRSKRTNKHQLLHRIASVKTPLIYNKITFKGFLVPNPSYEQILTNFDLNISSKPKEICLKKIIKFCSTDNFFDTFFAAIFDTSLIHNIVVIFSLCYTFSRQYTTAASFIFGLTRPI